MSCVACLPPWLFGGIVSGHSCRLQAGKKKDKKDKQPAGQNIIFVLPKDVPLGGAVTEYGRIDSNATLPKSKTVAEEFAQRNEEVAATLKQIEEKEPATTALFEETKGWSVGA